MIELMLVVFLLALAVMTTAAVNAVDFLVAGRHREVVAGNG